MLPSLNLVRGLGHDDGAAYTVSGETIHLGRSSICYAGIRVNSDGTIDKYGPWSTDFNQIDSSTDWVIPNILANGHYARVDVLSGDAPDPAASATGTWLPISANPHWWFFCNTVLTPTEGLWRLRIARDSGGIDVVADSNDTTDYNIKATRIF